MLLRDDRHTILSILRLYYKGLHDVIARIYADKYLYGQIRSILTCLLWSLLQEYSHQIAVSTISHFSPTLLNGLRWHGHFQWRSRANTFYG